MWKHPTWQTARNAVTATAIAAVVTGGGAYLTTSTAVAATTVTDRCAGSVSGTVGELVAIPGRALSEIVRIAAKTHESLLGLNGVDSDALATAIANKGTLKVGQVRDAPIGFIDGATIALVTTHALRDEAALGGGLLGERTATLQAVRDGVANSCGLTLFATNYSSAAPAAGQVPRGDRTGGRTTDAPGASSVAAPPRDYENLSESVPGDAAVSPDLQYAADSPQPGQQPAEAGSGDDDPHSAGVRNTGNTESLASPGAPTGLQWPMLLAVIVLAAVTAGLARTRVLRKTA